MGKQVSERFLRYLQDVGIAHKTCDARPLIANDAGIIRVKKQPIVLVVFTGHHRGWTERLRERLRIAAPVVKHYGGTVS